MTSQSYEIQSLILRNHCASVLASAKPFKSIHLLFKLDFLDHISACQQYFQTTHTDAAPCAVSLQGCVRLISLQLRATWGDSVHALDEMTTADEASSTVSAHCPLARNKLYMQHFCWIERVETPDVWDEILRGCRLQLYRSSYKLINSLFWFSSPRFLVKLLW